MVARRHGSKEGFWNNATVSNGDVSTSVETGRGSDNLVFYITTDGAANFTVQVAHSGDEVFGVNPDRDDQNFVWHDLYVFQGGAASLVEFQMGGAGSWAGLVDAFVPGWVRLKCTSGTDVNVTAGWEEQSD